MFVFNCILTFHTSLIYWILWYLNLFILLQNECKCTLRAAKLPSSSSLGMFVELWKGTVGLIMSVRLSVCVEHFGFHCTDFHAILCFRIFRKSIKKTLANDQLDAQVFNTFITILYMYMFWAISCSSSGGQIVLIQHLVSSLSVSDRPVHRCTGRSLTEIISTDIRQNPITACC